jgi:hypothetical protein
MMKARFSAWVVFAGLLCFAPCALGQGSISSEVASVGNSVLNAAPSLLIFGPQSNQHNNGCNSQERGPRGWESSNCKSVPEGGTTFMYLSLAGLFCMGAMALGSRRRALRAKQTS